MADDDAVACGSVGVTFDIVDDHYNDAGVVHGPCKT